MLIKMGSVGCGTILITFGTELTFALEQKLKCIRTPIGFLTTPFHFLK